MTLTSGDTSWVGVPSTVTVPAGAAEVGFAIQTRQALYLIGDLSVPITASLGAVTVEQALLLQPGLRYIRFGSGAEVIGGDDFAIELSLNGGVPEGGTTVMLESDNAAAQVPPSLTIPAGSSGIPGLHGRSTQVTEDVTVTRP